MKNNKKLKKFLRDPKQFISDMYAKRLRRFGILGPKTKHGYQQYTVISAVYNVGRYLDDYFQSLIDQRLDFQRNIQLVMVDDGSTDDSAEVIKRWQKRYPNNIVYLYKENGGQASARNLGLDHVKTDWVTFIDPDDTIDLRYFLEIDYFLKRHEAQNLQLVSCNFIFYLEDRKQLSDRHPLRYRFAKGDLIRRHSDLGQHIQLSVNSALFRTAAIAQSALRFDARIRPNFEDAHFANAYLAGRDEGHVGFASKAKYYYRKRSDGSSTLDTSWQKEGLFDEVLEFGCLDLFALYMRRHGFVPTHVQRTVLYHLIWYIRRITDRPESLTFLSAEKRCEFLTRLDALFAFISVGTVVEFELAGCWFLQKVGILHAFKQAEPPFQIVYIEDYDPVKSQILIRYFSGSIGLEAFLINGQDVLPAFAKTVHHDFLDRTFTLERRIWLPLPEHAEPEVLRVTVGTINARLSLAGKQRGDGLTLRAIRAHFLSLQPKHTITPVYEGAWLLMDRDTQADDNAEHLYRYICKEYPLQKIFFILRRESHDWPRLALEGFNLLDFGSAEHQDALRSCAKIVSSHADKYVVDYFEDGSLRDKKFIFLQHGVTKDDLSAWLNSKQRIDCLVTAAIPEYFSIAGDNNRYKFTQKEVVLTGFPRYDALLQARHPTERIILIMPTWRPSLVGKVVAGNQRERVPDFISTEYACAWKGVLHNPDLHRYARQYDYRVVFFPHANIQPYLADFDLPTEIEVLDHAHIGIQELFQKAALLITDYSSVAFELALLNKPILYYQFDEASVFTGGHIYQKGYFDYRSDGFGPVVTQEGALLDALGHLLAQEAQPDPQYLARMNAFFPFRDGRNCERVYQAIMDLDAPLAREAHEDMEIVLTHAMAKMTERRVPEKENIRKIRIAAVTMQKNETTLLRTWISYYLYLFGSDNIVIVDNGSDVPESIDILRAAEVSGIKVIWEYSDAQHFDNRGKLLSGIIDNLLTQFDFVLPLDADEILIFDEAVPAFPTPQEIHEHFEKLLDVKHQYLRINAQFDNVPGTNQVYPYLTKKVVVKSGDPVNLDNGLHMFNWDTQSDRVEMAPSGLALLHFHNRSYADLITASREKLKTKVDDFSSETLTRHTGGGRHLIKHFKRAPDAEVTDIKTRFDIGVDWMALNIGPIPFSSITPSPTAEHIKELLDPRNFFYISGRDEKKMRALERVAVWVKKEKKALHFGVGPATLLMCQSGCNSIEVVECSVSKIASCVTHKDYAGYVHTGRLRFYCDLTDDIRLSGAPRKHLKLKEVAKSLARISDGDHTLLILSGPFRRLALAVAYLSGADKRAKIILTGEHNLEAIGHLYKVEDIAGSYYQLASKPDVENAAFDLLSKELLYWTDASSSLDTSSLLEGLVKYA